MTIYHQPPGTARPAPDTLNPADVWCTYAACLGLGDLMFPNPTDAEAIRDARDICDRCPLTVATECLRDALRAEGNASKAYRWGICAGLTPWQRRALWERYGRPRTPP